MSSRAKPAAKKSLDESEEEVSSEAEEDEPSEEGSEEEESEEESEEEESSEKPKRGKAKAAAKSKKPAAKKAAAPKKVVRKVAAKSGASLGLLPLAGGTESLQRIINSMWDVTKLHQFQALLLAKTVTLEDTRGMLEKQIKMAMSDQLRSKELEQLKTQLLEEASKYEEPAKSQLKNWIDIAIVGGLVRKKYLQLLLLWLYKPSKTLLPAADQANFFKEVPLYATKLSIKQREQLRSYVSQVYKNSLNVPEPERAIIRETLPMISEVQQAQQLMNLEYVPGIVRCTGIELSGASGKILNVDNQEIVNEAITLVLSMGFDLGREYLSKCHGPGDILFCSPLMKQAQSTYDTMVEQLVFQPKISGGIYVCKRCGSKDVAVAAKQTRSADEPMTVFCKCLSCNKTWKDG